MCIFHKQCRRASRTIMINFIAGDKYVSSGSIYINVNTRTAESCLKYCFNFGKENYL